MTSPPPGPAIMRVLDLSTAHLPPAYATEGPGLAEGVNADTLTYGWLMYVPENPDEHAGDYADPADPDDPTEGVPPEILTVQRYARSHGCDYVRFDPDGLTDPNLPTWDW